MTPTIAEIQARVCERFGVSRREMVGRDKTARVARPRQVAMYLAYRRWCLTRSGPLVGRAFGGRDHTTVFHARRQIKALRAIDPGLDAVIRALKRELRP